MIWGALAALLFWLSQILDNHKLLMPSLISEVFGVLASARFGWIGFVNEGGRHRLATALAVTYVLLGWGVCGWLFYSQRILPDDAFSVSLSVGTPSDPKDPFGIRLIMQNQSQQSIYDVGYRLYLNDPNGPTKRIMLVKAFLPKISVLKRLRKHSLAFGDPSIQWPLSDKVFAQVEIEYIPKGWKHPKVERFQFLVVRDKVRETYDWLDFGEGKSLKQVFGEMPSPTKPVDMIPFPSVEIISIENVPLLNAYNTVMAYSVSNLGGFPAFNFSLSWSQVDIISNTQSSFISLAPSPFPCTILSEGSMTNRTALGIETTAAVFNAILANKVICIGDIRFEDHLKHPYTMTIKTIHTNDHFEVRIIDFSGFPAYFEQFRGK
jgi:hypothetical protein